MEISGFQSLRNGLRDVPPLSLIHISEPTRH